ncbi:class I SAM-dependent methyltransferase [Opitutales bacterium ASA1]|uniref:methyltransferase domain-containing protein n=1 Tax=Congregicoccus parvus TaxID=3081749 RepID=UPI002B290086|nr:class I SAM-dependent methyltransferase [Opitutales bacterium ASA1]
MKTPSFDLSDFAFFGRSLAEYHRFLGFRPEELTGLRVLDCAAGPSSFAAEAAFCGIDVVAVDPLYALNETALRMTVAAAYDRMARQMHEKRELLTFRAYPTIDDAVRSRRAAAERFLADYYTGRAVGRYVAAALPTLPFGEATFDHAFCAHLLFVYERLLDFEAHLAACLELARVTRPGGEIRIHPIVDPRGEESALLHPLRDALDAHGIASRIEHVDYSFFRGTHRTLVLTSRSRQPHRT